MAKSSTSFGQAIFKTKCPSCQNIEAIGKRKCPQCGSQMRSNGQVIFKSEDGLARVEPVKEPVKTDTGSPVVEPVKRKVQENEKKKPVKSPSKARPEPVEPVTGEPVRARKSVGFWEWLGQ